MQENTHTSTANLELQCKRIMKGNIKSWKVWVRNRYVMARMEENILDSRILKREKVSLLISPQYLVM